MTDDPAEDRDEQDGGRSSPDPDATTSDEFTWAADGPSGAGSDAEPAADEGDEPADNAGAEPSTHADGSDGPDARVDAAAAPGSDDPPADDPFAELGAGGDVHGDGDGDDPFEEMDVDDVDAETVWEALDRPDQGVGPSPAATGAAEAVGDAGGEGGEASGSDAAGSDGDSAPGASGASPPEHVLDKREYCQRCPYFSAPPETACEHDASEILEVVDRDRFRVRNCPMVPDDGGRPAFDRES